jgi:hypothetical protein
MFPHCKYGVNNFAIWYDPKMQHLHQTLRLLGQLLRWKMQGASVWLVSLAWWALEGWHPQHHQGALE